MSKGVPVKLEYYGDGSLKKKIQAYIETKNLEPFVCLIGNQKQEVIKDAYKNSHFLVLASKSEGWPKAVAEAMFFGCIPVATSVSCVPWMLDYGKRGILLSDGEKREKRIEKRGVEEGTNEKEWMEESVDKIIELIGDPEEMKRKSLAAQEWSQEYTLENFEEAIKEVLAPKAPKGE
jgi:glycosyltransferase involved in cell wall biosynthesis